MNNFGSTVCFEVAPDNYLSRKFIEAEIWLIEMQRKGALQILGTLSVICNNKF